MVGQVESEPKRMCKTRGEARREELAGAVGLYTTESLHWLA